MGNARASDAVSKLSAAFTMATLAGLAGILCVALPANGPVKFAGASVATPPAPTARPATVATPAPAVMPAAPSAPSIEVVRTHAIDADAVQKQPEAEMQLLAAKKSTTDSPPKSTWDGTPQHRQGNAKPAEAPTNDKVGGKSAEPSTTSAPAASPNQKPADGAAAPTATAAPVPPVVEEWSPVEIAAALKECVKLLGPVAAEIEPVDAMRKGPCGAPAPVLLKSLGTTERIEFSPPVEINCALVVKLADWSEKVLQPTARNMLNSRVTKISGASGYQCRNRYGLANAPLSEHALANAVDVPGFVLADGRSIKVKSGWGPTARDLVAKADPDKPSAADAKAVAGKADEKPDAKTATKSGDKADKTDKAQKAEPSDKTNKNDKAGKKEKTAAGKVPSEPDVVGKPGDDKMKLAALKGGAYQKLGAGPTVTAAQASAAAPAILSVEGKFLRELSKGACQTFGTVLGPEANEAHRDHFHFDIKVRRKAAFCQ